MKTEKEIRDMLEEEEKLLVEDIFDKEPNCQKLHETKIKVLRWVLGEGK